MFNVITGKENYEQGVKHYNACEFKQALSCFELATAHNYPAADLWLGIIYEHGRGVRIDKKKSNVFYLQVAKQIHWFKDQAGERTPLAQYNLGYLHYYGYGIKKDILQAMIYFHWAAAQGDSSAQHILGDCYLNVDEVRNYEKAVKYLKLSADQGNALAQNNLGYFYKNGLGVTKDYKEAVKYFKPVADKGNTVAKHNLRDCFYKLGKKENDNMEAFKYLTLAADLGNAEARIKLQDASYEEPAQIMKAVSILCAEAKTEPPELPSPVIEIFKKYKDKIFIEIQKLPMTNPFDINEMQNKILLAALKKPNGDASDTLAGKIFWAPYNDNVVFRFLSNINSVFSFFADDNIECDINNRIFLEIANLLNKRCIQPFCDGSTTNSVNCTAIL